MKKFFTFLLLLAGLGLGANNLQINNVALTDNDPVAKTVMIRFDISWDNSWRDDINWDAAWVFAKYFDGEKPYKHCKLSLDGALAGTGTTHALVIPNDSLQLEGTFYGVGAYIYRDALGDGTFAAGSVMLKWNYGLNGFETLPEDIEMHVYGTEMVYIPEGPFAFGDGDGFNMSQYSWHLKDTPDYVYIDDYLAPLMINPWGGVDDQARITGIRVHGTEGLDWDGDGDIDNPRFPTGYKAFYMMKYETTQGQYSDFLNSLSESQITQSELFPNTIQYRFTITLQDGKYVCSRPDRACNYLYNYRPLSLADWMGLRPMSALEFEKSARGPVNPTPNENASGTIYNEPMYAITGEENGTELPAEPAANYNAPNSNSLSGGDGGYGPVRSGIFAKENTDRLGSGASYYGVMELSGNMAECMTELFYSDDSRGCMDFHGDGEIFEWGYANSFFYLDQYGNLNGFNTISIRRYTRISNYEGGSIYFIGARFVRNAPILP